MNVPEGRKVRRGRGPLAPIRSIMFIDNTGGGELARRLQDAENELGSATGYRVKIAESAGTPMGMLLPSTNPWGPPNCERADCVPCSQADIKRLDCRKRNILYENRCELCNKDGKKEQEKKLKDGQGIYVGESSRSLYERAREHEADKLNKAEDSHQIKHWLTDHPELLSPPKFRFKVIQTFKDPLSRQLAEAVRIDLRGPGVLNSKSEYSRCRVPRLTVDMEGWAVKKDDDKKSDDMKEAEDSLKERDLKRSCGDPPASRKSKRMKYDRVVGWGEQKTEQPLRI